VGVKVAGAWGWQTYHLYVLIVLKSGSLNFLEPSGPVQACNGIALPFTWKQMNIGGKKKTFAKRHTNDFQYTYSTKLFFAPRVCPHDV
jgi:hypothetical protein